MTQSLSIRDRVRSVHAGCVGTVVKVYPDGSASVCWDDGEPQAEGLGHERMPRSLLEIIDAPTYKYAQPGSPDFDGAEASIMEIEDSVPLIAQCPNCFLCYEPENVAAATMTVSPEEYAQFEAFRSGERAAGRALMDCAKEVEYWRGKYEKAEPVQRTPARLTDEQMSAIATIWGALTTTADLEFIRVDRKKLLTVYNDFLANAQGPELSGYQRGLNEAARICDGAFQYDWDAHDCAVKIRAAFDKARAA